MTHKRTGKKFHKHQKVVFSSNTDEYIEDVAVFSGSERVISTDSFKGGNVTAVFGGSSFDFTNSQLADGKHELEMSIIFGGSKLKVPSDWNVRIEVISVFGGFVDKRLNNKNVSDNSKVLVIKGVAVFGGGEISAI